MKNSLIIREIFIGAPELTADNSIDEAMISINEYVREVLECDRATVYALDHESGLLWSQVASGKEKPFSVPLGSGVAGFAADQNKVVNIREAYEDPKFNKSYDIMSGYRTRTILVIPIRNRFGYVEGAIQAINKLPEKDGKLKIFTTVDEGMLEMLGRLAGMFLKSTMNSKKQKFYVNILTQILKFGIYLASVKGIFEVVKFCQNEIRDLFSSPEVVIYIKHPLNKKLIKFEEKNHKIEKVYLERKIGLVGKVLEKKCIEKIRDCKNHPDFNGILY